MMVRRGTAGGTSGAEGAPRHIPVLLNEMLTALSPRDGETYIDGTFGAGGYSRAILEAAPEARVLAIERDPDALRGGADLVAELGGRLTLAPGRFGGMAGHAAANGVTAVDGIVLDIGVSSMQLDQAERGFSFMAEGPLDMRMERDGPSAATVVNEAEEGLIADILFHLGEERRSRAVARAIVRARDAAPLATTADLARVVEKALGRARGDEKHPATRTFQALRIWVNAELDELLQGLRAAEVLLKPGGRLVVVTFHSLEDRIAKRFLAQRSGRTEGGSRHAPQDSAASTPPSFRIVNQRPLTASAGELDANPRARSAKLRSALRTEAPAWPGGDASDLGLPVFDTERRGRGRR
jgi:16S rRNA (cytosine1402-N4)-methyltransferase